MSIQWQIKLTPKFRKLALSLKKYEIKNFGGFFVINYFVAIIQQQKSIKFVTENFDKKGGFPLVAN